MTDQLKPQAWLINDDYHCTGIIKQSEDGSHERTIEHWIKEDKAIPLYEIPEGYALVPVEPTPEMLSPFLDWPFISSTGTEIYVARTKYKAMLNAAKGET